MVRRKVEGFVSMVSRYCFDGEQKYRGIITCFAILINFAAVGCKVD